MSFLTPESLKKYADAINKFLETGTGFLGTMELQDIGQSVGHTIIDGGSGYAVSDTIYVSGQWQFTVDTIDGSGSVLTMTQNVALNHPNSHNPFPTTSPQSGTGLIVQIDISRWTTGFVTPINPGENYYGGISAVQYDDTNEIQAPTFDLNNDTNVIVKDGRLSGVKINNNGRFTSEPWVTVTPKPITNEAEFLTAIIRYDDWMGFQRLTELFIESRQNFIMDEYLADDLDFAINFTLADYIDITKPNIQSDFNVY